MIIFGLRASNIGSVKVDGSTCSYCENSGTQNITQFGRYFHIFWIPVFPLGKSTFSECDHCKRTVRKREFTTELKDVFNSNKSAIKRPVWHWTGLILIGFLVTTFYVLAKI